MIKISNQIYVYVFFILLSYLPVTSFSETKFDITGGINQVQPISIGSEIYHKTLYQQLDEQTSSYSLDEVIYTYLGCQNKRIKLEYTHIMDIPAIGFDKITESKIISLTVDSNNRVVYQTDGLDPYNETLIIQLTGVRNAIIVNAKQTQEL